MSRFSETSFAVRGLEESRHCRVPVLMMIKIDRGVICDSHVAQQPKAEMEQFLSNIKHEYLSDLASARASSLTPVLSRGFGSKRANVLKFFMFHNIV